MTREEAERVSATHNASTPSAARTGGPSSRGDGAWRVVRVRIRAASLPI